MHVGVVTLPNTFGFALTTVLDLVRVADALRPSVDRRLPRFRATMVGPVGRVPVAAGISADVQRPLTERMDDLDVLVVPSLGVLTAPGVERALGRPDVRSVVDAVRQVEVPTLAAACTGTFVLGEAGRLDDRRATTCWWLTDTFAQRYPTTDLDQSRMVVRSERIVTAGAAFAHVDLMISLVADVSGRLAETVARHVLVDDRPARSVPTMLGHPGRTDELVMRFEDEVRERMGEPLAIPEIAEALHVTRRTLERRIRQCTGLSPGQLVQRLRSQRAEHLGQTTELSMQAIAHQVGYASAVTLRRAMTSRP